MESGRCDNARPIFAVIQPVSMPTDQPITQYVELPKNWEPWKSEYQFGALYVFPPQPLRAALNELRLRYDPQSQAYCDAHISLTIPLPRALYLKDFSEFEKLLGGFSKFSVAYQSPTSYPDIPGVVLRTQPEDKFRVLAQMLEACTPFKGAPPRKWPFSPHLTIAEFVNPGKTEQIIKDLSGAKLTGTFLCDEIAYAVPDSEFRFTERARFKLG